MHRFLKASNSIPHPSSFDKAKSTKDLEQKEKKIRIRPYND